MNYFMRTEREGGEEEWPFMLKTHSDSPLTIQLERTLTQESIWVDILNGREKLILGVQYRPPNLRREDTSSLLQEINRACRNKNLCFWGDYNFRRIDWERVFGDLESEDFLRILQNNFLKQLVTEPTRGDNMQDLVLTNNENMISEVDVGS